MVQIPLTPALNQTFQVSLTINDQPLNLQLTLRYISGAYWVMTAADCDTKTVYVSNLPLVPGGNPSQNILSQFNYLRIGCAYLVKVDAAAGDLPGLDNLGTGYVLLWDDNMDAPNPKGLNTGDVLVWGQ